MNTPKILIVEDESIVALDMRAKLQRYGYQVVGIADSGREALQQAADWRPDLALMDIRLKGDTDGIATAAQLRARFGIPVIYLTAYADDVTVQRARPTQPLGYLIKPIDERELYSTIEMAVYKLEMDRKLQQQAARLERIMATIPEGIALLDANGRVMLANDRAQTYLAELAGAAVGDLVERMGETALRDLLPATPIEVRHEITLSVSFPRVFDVVISSVGTAAEGDQDQPGDWLLVIRDVTVERQIQQQIALQERLATVGQLAAGIAHDFNNILSSIILQPYMIRKLEPKLAPASLERLDNISNQARRASELVKQILDFSRTSSVEMQPIDLTNLLNEFAQMLERMLPENIHLAVVCPPGDYTVNGDPTRILQVLMNLAVNARDAMPDGGELRISVTRVKCDEAFPDSCADSPEWIRVSVSDTGSGIQPEVMKRIFEPFFTTKPTGQGTGLGLAQVYGIVQQHGGHIRVDSQVGRATTFDVYFPAQMHLFPVMAETETRSDLPQQGNQQTILLVEDNLSARESISEVLRLTDYQVLEAGHGREALAILEQPGTSVDLVISDLTMPEMGGLELCRELRHRNIDVDVIILSGYISDEASQALESLDIMEIIDKPVDVTRLLDMVSRALVDASVS